MLWVTMTDGEVRQYKTATHYNFVEKRLKIGSGTPLRKNMIASLDPALVAHVEFQRPCEITFAPNALDRSLDILLMRARSVKGPSLVKLAELTKLLRNFNPQRKEWTR